MRKVGVSFLTSKNIKKDLERISNSKADYIHVDVADGKFVKEKHLPFKSLERYSNLYQKRLDVHLMVQKPKAFIDSYATLNVEYITVHIELKEDLLELIDQIKQYGIKAGLSVNPKTDIELIYPYLDEVSQVLVMCVEPGRGGQVHIDMSDKVKALKEEIGSRNVIIAVDGGINNENVSLYDDADLIISGSYVLGSDDLNSRIGELR